MSHGYALIAFIRYTLPSIASPSNTNELPMLLLFENLNERAFISRNYGYETRWNNQTIGAAAAKSHSPAGTRTQGSRNRQANRSQSINGN